MQRFFDFPASLWSFFQETDLSFDRPGMLEPLDTPLRSVALPGIRAVLWDIYGTLLGCALGDLEASLQDPQRQTQAAALLIERFSLQGPLRQLNGHAPLEIALRDRYLALIDQSHRQSRAAGVEYPEVIIQDIWLTIVEDCRRQGWTSPNEESPYHTACRWAYFFEAAFNKTYLYPGAAECLDHLHRASLVQGIISNAQFYTPIRLRHFLRRQLARDQFQLEDIFIEPLVLFSYELGFSKPNPIAFCRCLDRLKQQGIPPEQTLYVGNDMLNDIYAAQQHNLRTALFVGDRGQAKLRPDEPRCRNIEPDIIIADLDQLPTLLVNQ